MNLGTKPDILITHASCQDGFACAWTVRQKWPDVPVVFATYGDTPPDVRGARVLITDFSYSEEVLRAMTIDAAEVVILDHHASSEERIKKLIQENILQGEWAEHLSGAGLTWRYVWGGAMPKLIGHVQDRDLWKFENPDTRAVTAYLASVGYDYRAWTQVGQELESGRHAPILMAGEAILRQRDVDMAQAIDAGVRVMTIGGVEVPVCNAPFFWASDIGNKLSEGAPFAATYMDLSDGSRQFSLRTRTPDEYPVNEIAATYGGGGHKAAAGFKMPKGWEGDPIVLEGEEPVETIALKPGAQIKVGA